MYMGDMNVPHCAACGKGGEGLKTCTACKLVKYCSVTCQKNHRREHKKECQKRAAELFDYELFKEPPEKEVCPICFLPLPFSKERDAEFRTTYQQCCGKSLCEGCVYSCAMESNDKCPFCRHLAADGEVQDSPLIERLHVRMEADDADATQLLGCNYYYGDRGLMRDPKKGMKLWLQAMELGSVEACAAIASVYLEKDKKKAKYYFELGAKRGDEGARHLLGLLEKGAGNMDRAVKHWMIAAVAGYDPSLRAIGK